MAVLTEKNAILLNVGVGQEEESIHFPFYSSKIGRIANFQSSNSIPHCLFKENLFSITEDPLEENEEDEFAFINKVITVAYVSS